MSTPVSRRSPSRPPDMVGCWYTPLGTATAHMSNRFTKLVNLPSLAFLVHVTYTQTDSHQRQCKWVSQKGKADLIEHPIRFKGELKGKGG